MGIGTFMSNLICGINPISISSITYRRFKRYGPHPSWTKLMQKKNPIRGFLGLYNSGLFDGYCKPRVEIRGTDRAILLSIDCRSNDHAKMLCAKLNDQLEDFLTNLQQ